MNRRLLILVGSVVLLDTLFYAALAPLLPSLSAQFGLNKGGAGLLVGIYPIGTFLGAIPAGWATSRYGPRPTALVSLAVMAAAALVFAFGQTIELLYLGRLLQGIGGAVSWTAGLAWLVQGTSRARRGEALGIGIGAGVVGAQFGPVLGSVAHLIGRGPAFAATALAAGVIAVVAFGTPEPHVDEETSSESPLALLRSSRYLFALMIFIIPSMAFGVIEVLAPLSLSTLGASAELIGLIFFVAGTFEAVGSPIVGRMTDRIGVLLIVRSGMFLAAILLVALYFPTTVLALSLVLISCSAAIGVLWVPAGKLVSLAAERLEVDQGWAFALQNSTWSLAMGAGATAGGALAAFGGDLLAYAAAAAACALVGALMFTRRPIAAVRSEP
jgi:predicted MFS family arabinose efflux permease